jgi:hypothetical protein
MMKVLTPATEKICTTREEACLQDAENNAKADKDIPSGSKAKAL